MSRQRGPSKGRDPRRGGVGRPPASTGRAPKRSGGPSNAGVAASAPRRRGRSNRYGLGGDQVEGRQAVRELLLAGRRKVREVYLVSDMDQADILDDIRGLAAEHRVLVHEVSRRQLDAISGTESAQGVVAMAQELEPVDIDDLCASADVPPFLVALDGVTDPRNLGAILRTAECAGVSGVLLPQHRSAHITPTAAKTAAGAIEHVPMSLVGGIPAAMERMKRHGLWVVGLDAGGDTSIFSMAVADGPICLVMGAEGRGLSRLVRGRCDAVASIPLAGQLDSLNVSAASAVALFEVVRHRANRS